MPNPNQKPMFKFPKLQFSLLISVLLMCIGSAIAVSPTTPIVSVFLVLASGVLVYILYEMYLDWRPYRKVIEVDLHLPSGIFITGHFMKVLGKDKGLYLGTFPFSHGLKGKVNLITDNKVPGQVYVTDLEYQYGIGVGSFEITYHTVVSFIPITPGTYKVYMLAPYGTGVMYFESVEEKPYEPKP